MPRHPRFRTDPGQRHKPASVPGRRGPFRLTPAGAVLLLGLVLSGPTPARGEADGRPLGLSVPNAFETTELVLNDEGSSGESGSDPSVESGSDPGLDPLEELSAGSAMGGASGSGDSGETFADMDIEQLMQVRVTSVAGVRKDWFETPAAISVLTPEEIHDSGMRFIPEALRLVPGMNVARLNASTWAISARGFNSRFANKLQVLIDGRIVYDPLFSGVFWDVQEVFLPDLDRIEVIRGPGATLWGANAVNGVINITTKSARHTQGLFVKGGVGTEVRGFGGARYGGQLGKNTYYRVYGKYHNHDGSVDEQGRDRPDDWDMARGGFRLDHEGANNATITLQGDVYGSGRIGEGVRTAEPTGHFATDVSFTDGRASGGNLQFRIEREDPRSASGWQFKTYYDRRNRVAGDGFQVERDIFNIDFRHHFMPIDRHKVVWGSAYRFTHDDTQSTDTLAFEPESRSLHKVSAFVQDTVTLLPDTLFGMVGSKFEHNDHTGFELQPSARLWWTPDDRQTLWGAISRPVRTPSRTEDDLRLTAAYAAQPNGTLVPLMIRGSEESEAEKLTAYEAGYRVKLLEDVTVDTATFYNEYRDLLSPGRNNIGTFENSGSAETYGVETALRWRIAENWRAQGSYSFHRVQIHGDASTDEEGSSPRHQFQIRSTLDVVEELSLHGALYYYDNLPAHDIPAFFRLDLGVSWRPTEHLELSVRGQNLLDPSHPEFRDEFFQDSVSEIERSVYFQASLRF